MNKLGLIENYLTSRGYGFEVWTGTQSQYLHFSPNSKTSIRTISIYIIHPDLKALEIKFMVHMNRVEPEYEEVINLLDPNSIDRLDFLI